MEASGARQSLYQRLGGEFTLRKVVDAFYERVLADPVLQPYFAGTDLNRLKRHQALFLSQALGGPRRYDGRSLAEAHRALHIRGADFDRVAGHLVDTLQALGVSAETIDEVAGAVLPLKDEIVNEPAESPAPAGAPAPDAEATAPGGNGQMSLYDRLGGGPAVKAVVETFYQRVMADGRLKPVFAGIDMGRLKRHQALFLSQALGGPKTYDGRDMFEAHKAFLITEAQFGAVAEHLAAALQAHGVNAEDVNTVLAAVAPLKADIVLTPFQRWLRGG